jgi:hypothetical protein
VKDLVAGITAGLVALPLAKLIPMAVLAAILMMPC